ncbi:Uncharacterised protein [Mycobacteroides abscessus subsp. massiliense]|nr:Uncharacterised protein [Mycobacteroides abscessus subsp. massiliense]
MRKHRDGAAVDAPQTGDHTIGVRRVGITGSAGERVEFQETALVEQRVDAGAGTRDALLVAPGDGLGITRLAGERNPLTQVGELLRSCVWWHGV